MPQPEKTVAQEIIEDGTEKAPEMITVGSEEGKKPTLEGESGETKQQEFEKELFKSGDSKETPPEEGAEEEPTKESLDKAKTDAAFWQTQYQEFDAIVKKADPTLRDNLNKQLRAQRKGKTDDSFEESVTKVKEDNAELKGDIYEVAPEKLLEAIDKRVEAAASRAYEKMHNQTYQQASWEQEAQAAEQAVNQLKSNYRAELRLDDNTWKGVEDNAWQDVMDVLGLTDDNKNDFLGSLGGPSRAAKVFQKSLENRLLKHSYLSKVTEGQADISSKIKAATEVAQPTSQASPAPKTKSKADKIVEAIEGAVGPKQATEELFG